jgi:hypothetical protein
LRLEGLLGLNFIEIWLRRQMTKGYQRLPGSERDNRKGKELSNCTVLHLYLYMPGIRTCRQGG